MSLDLLVYGGLAICGITVVGAVIAIILFRIFKARLNKHLNSMYGKRRG